MTDTTPTDELIELKNRVEQLEEQQHQLRQGAVDAQGRTWTVSDLLNMGLTRRQAMTAVGAIAGGASIGAAIYQAIEPAAAQAEDDDGDDDVGTTENPVDIFADGISAESVQTGEVSIDRYGPHYISIAEEISYPGPPGTIDHRDLLISSERALIVDLDADGSRGGGSVVFASGGSQIARLNSDGDLYLAGTVQENETF